MVADYFLFLIYLDFYENSTKNKKLTTIINLIKDGLIIVIYTL